MHRTYREADFSAMNLSQDYPTEKVYINLVEDGYWQADFTPELIYPEDQGYYLNGAWIESEYWEHQE